MAGPAPYVEVPVDPWAEPDDERGGYRRTEQHFHGEISHDVEVCGDIGDDAFDMPNWEG